MTGGVLSRMTGGVLSRMTVCVDFEDDSYYGSSIKDFEDD
jgi:hypothetical protein